MTVRELRDPSQPCEHTLDPLGMYDGAYFDEDGQFWRCDHDGMCPGGKLVRLRAVKALNDRRFRWLYEIVEAKEGDDPEEIVIPHTAAGPQGLCVPDCKGGPLPHIEGDDE